MAATIIKLAEYIRRRRAERRATRDGLVNFVQPPGAPDLTTSRVHGYPPCVGVDDARAEGLTLDKIRKARDYMAARDQPMEIRIEMPGDGPWELQRFGDWLFAVSSTHGLYYLEGTTWMPVPSVMGPETI